MCTSMDTIRRQHHSSNGDDNDNNRYFRNSGKKATMIPSGSSNTSSFDNIIIKTDEDLNSLLQQKFILLFLGAYVIFYDFIQLNCRLFTLLKRIGETHCLKYCLFWRRNNNNSTTTTTTTISNERKQIQYKCVPDRVRVIRHRTIPSSSLRHFSKLSKKSSFYKLYDIEEETVDEKE